MNKCMFVGRMVADPELKATSNGLSVCSFRIAVNRRFKDANGQRVADFIACVAWRKIAEYVNNYLRKGDLIAASGELQNRQYTAQDGTKRFITEIIVNEVQACGSARNGAQEANQDVPPADNYTSGGFTEVDDDELPF